MNTGNTSYPIRYILISLSMLGVGMLFYGLYNNLIIIQLPQRANMLQTHKQHSAEQKHLSIWYWNGEQLIKEDRELIYSNMQDTLTDLVARWLSVLEEEKQLPKKVMVQSVLLDTTQTTAYISFDRSPLKKELSTYDKLMIIESLLKTIRESDVQIKKVQFLINHTPMHDAHLDFSHLWTIQGYSKT